MPCSFRSSLLVAVALVSGSFGLQAQQRDYLVAGKPVAAMPADPKIEAALQSVSADKIHATIEKLVSFKTRNTLSSMETDLPQGTGINAAEEWIKSQFEAYSTACGGCLEVKVDEFTAPAGSGTTGPTSNLNRIPRPTVLRNVYAILRGTDPAEAKRMYLITGHYDSIESDVLKDKADAPGANDDASGTAVSLENARVLSQYKFPATLVFVTVAGEEQGLVGSSHLAKLAKSEGWQLEGVLNNDIVGGNTTPGDKLQDKTAVRVFSQGIPPATPLSEIQALMDIGAESDSASRELARAIVDAGRTYFAPAARGAHYGTFTPVMEMRLDRFKRGGDHKSFNDAGFAAVRFTEWRENFAHEHQTPRTENGVEYGDLIQFDDFNYMAQVARMNMAALATLASSPGEPQHVVVVNTAYAIDTTLRWEAPAGAPAGTRYEVLWRETAAPDWQYVAEVADYAGNKAEATAVTIPVSKDNVFFGVRACDKAGHCSQTVAPLPVAR